MIAATDESYPSVTLGGTVYTVPPVAFREVSKILPLINPVFTSIRANDLSEAILEGLGKIIFYGVKRGCPELKYEEFIDRPATVEEMVTAAIAICDQAGLKRKADVSGEAAGAKTPS